MKALTCEMCGSTNLLKDNGVFVCQSCGTKYSVEEAKKMPGIHYVRAWLNSGELSVGDDIMYVLVGGDIRPNVIDGLQALVEKLKTECVVETEVPEK